MSQSINPGDHVHDFFITNRSSQRVLWVTYRDIEGKWEVHRFTLKNDAVNMGYQFSDAGIVEVIRHYAQHGFNRIPWDNVKNKIEKWSKL